MIIAFNDPLSEDKTWIKFARKTGAWVTNLKFPELPYKTEAGITKVQMFLNHDVVEEQVLGKKEYETTKRL